MLEDLGSPGSLYFIRQHNADGEEIYSLDSTTGEYKLNYELDEISDYIVMDGNDIKSADATYEGNSNSVDSKEPVVSLTLKNDAIDKWYEATSDALANGESIGIYYDDKLISVPTVSADIGEGK